MAAKKITVAITGPTGEIGQAFVRALEQAPGVGAIRGMARRPFDPASRGWAKTTYRQGDVRESRDVKKLVDGADVVVHLAFLIMGSIEDSRRINLEGSRNAFESAVSAGVKRIVYTSSVAAYGFSADNPPLLHEEDPAHGTDSHYYSAQKAEVEKVLAEAIEGSATAAYVMRPSIVAGPDAPLLIDQIPYTQLSERVPDPIRRLLEGVPILKPVLPDTGVPFQIVHHDDLSDALLAATLGRGKPGIYNIAGEGELTLGTLANELGWYSIPVPELAVDMMGEVVSRLPFLPAALQWIQAFREPALMDTTKARTELRWKPKYDAIETLRATIEASRADSLLR